MSKKMSSLISSTPHPERTRQLLEFFEDVAYSPITEPSHLEIPVGPQALTQPKSVGVRKAGAVRKRKVVSKEKAPPESVTAGVLRELGQKAEDVCNNALSHSRNWYNMFPKPIVLDSDEEEEEAATVKKPVKKSKQDGSVTITTKSKEEKRTKELAPGSSRTIRSTQNAANRTQKKHKPAQPINVVTSSLNVKETRSKTKDATKKKPLINQASTSSVVILDDDDDDDSLFPVYLPGSSVHHTSNRNKHKEKIRLSVELDEKFPIDWSKRRQKTGGSKLNEDPDVENIDVHEEAKEDVHKAKKDVHKIKKSEENNNKKRTDKPMKVRKKLTEILNESVKKSINDKMLGNKEDHGANGESQLLPVISRFANVKFKVNHNSGGIVAKSLNTDQNDVGFLEVPADKIFNGERTNITFVVTEGEAKVVHMGIEHTLLPGDMIHIRNDSGYQFQSAGPDHVRFLYVKPH